MNNISYSDMEIYRQAARQRQQALRVSRSIRYERGWEVAQKAAALLKERFGASRVVVFGSLLRPEVFDERSDVDLAAWGVADDKYIRAVAAVTALDREISVDLVQMEQARSSISIQVKAGVEI